MGLCGDQSDQVHQPLQYRPINHDTRIPCYLNLCSAPASLKIDCQSLHRMVHYRQFADRAYYVPVTHSQCRVTSPKIDCGCSLNTILDKVNEWRQNNSCSWQFADSLHYFPVNHSQCRATSPKIDCGCSLNTILAGIGITEWRRNNSCRLAAGDAIRKEFGPATANYSHYYNVQGLRSDNGRENDEMSGRLMGDRDDVDLDVADYYVNVRRIRKVKSPDCSRQNSYRGHRRRRSSRTSESRYSTLFKSRSPNAYAHEIERKEMD